MGPGSGQLGGDFGARVSHANYQHMLSNVGFRTPVHRAVNDMAMVTRYVITMVRYPGRRWFGGIIPIALHCVLAAFMFMVGSFRLF